MKDIKDFPEETRSIIERLIKQGYISEDDEIKNISDDLKELNEQELERRINDLEQIVNQYN